MEAHVASTGSQANDRLSRALYAAQAVTQTSLLLERPLCSLHPLISGIPKPEHDDVYRGGGLERPKAALLATVGDPRYNETAL